MNGYVEIDGKGRWFPLCCHPLLEMRLGMAGMGYDMGTFECLGVHGSLAQIFGNGGGEFVGVFEDESFDAAELVHAELVGFGELRCEGLMGFVDEWGDGWNWSVFERCFCCCFIMIVVGIHGGVERRGGGGLGNRAHE